jgi:hypothetical protein
MDGPWLPRFFTTRDAVHHAGFSLQSHVKSVYKSCCHEWGVIHHDRWHFGASGGLS